MPPAPLGPLHPTFQGQLERFQQYVLSCEPKATLGKHLIDGMCKCRGEGMSSGVQVAPNVVRGLARVRGRQVPDPMPTPPSPSVLAGLLERIVELLGRDETILLQEVCKELLEATMPVQAGLGGTAGGRGGAASDCLSPSSPA